MGTVKSIIGELLSSKKALATLASILVWVIGKIGLEVPAETLLPILGALAAYVLAQGWADAGQKEALKTAAKLGQLSGSTSSGDIIPGTASSPK